MPLSSRLRKRNPKHARTTRFRPQLERLGDRRVPSTLHVTNLSPDVSVPGSLAYELAHTSGSGKDTIVFNVTGQINLWAELDVTHGVTIKGPGAGRLTLTTNYNFGDPWGQSTRVFDVNASRPVVISGLTITDNGVNDSGAGVLNHGTLTMSNCDVSNNGASQDGGGIYNDGTLTLANCTFRYDGADQYGGGIYNAGALTATGCTFAFDSQDGFPVVAGDAIYNVGTLSIGTGTFVWDSIFGPYTDLGGNSFITQQPQIGSFTTGASTVAAGNNFTLTASGITDANPGATITQVGLWVNGYGGQPYWLAAETSPGVWTYTFDTTGWTPGTYTFYAQAVDSYGVPSPVVAVTVEVV